MPAPVRCCVVGLGWMGTLHAACLDGLPEAELIACCDPDADASARAPEGVPMRSFDELLDDEELEAIVVATPPDAHREVVVAALERDLHVLCEKPLARDLVDADAMIDAATRSRGSLVVGHLRRFDPRFIAVADAVADGRVGRPTHIVGVANCPREDAVRLAARTTLALESAVHDLDAMRWLAGEIERVHAEGADLYPTPGVDALTATVRFAAGAIGTLAHSWAIPDGVPLDWEFAFQVGGAAGVANIDGRSRGVTVLSERDTVIHPDTATFPRLHGVVGGALAVEDAHFLAGVRGDRAWPLSLDDARAAVAAGIAIDRSIAEGRPVTIDEIG